MHRTQGDGYILDPVSNEPIFADESPPTRDATQVRHEETNAWQEELCNVIEAEGFVLNVPTESIQQMTQLNTAIDKKVTDLQTSLLAIISLLDSSDIRNDSFVSGTSVTGALEELWDKIDGLDIVVSGLDSDDIDNASSVTGSKVTNALDNLNSKINALDASDIGNDSSIPGSTVRDALDALGTAQDVTTVETGNVPIDWTNLNTSHAGTLYWKRTTYANGRKKITLWFPDLDGTSVTGSGGAVAVSINHTGTGDWPAEIVPPTGDIFALLHGMYQEQGADKAIEFYARMPFSTQDRFEIWARAVGSWYWMGHTVDDVTPTKLENAWMEYYVN